MRILFIVVGLMFSLMACGQDKKADVQPVPKPPQMSEANTASAHNPHNHSMADVKNDGLKAAAFVEGKHYKRIKQPVRTITPGKIEVAEVFWYGCSHCYSFEPSLEAWKKTIAPDVALVKVPAIWRDVMNLHARMFYAVETLGLAEKANMKIFEAMNVDKKPLKNEKDIAAFMAQFGVSEEEFIKVLNSFSVKSQVQQADSRARGFGISSTPSVVVNGKYLVSPSTAGSHEDMLKVTNFLVEKERKGLKK